MSLLENMWLFTSMLIWTILGAVIFEYRQRSRYNSEQKRQRFWYSTAGSLILIVNIIGFLVFYTYQ